MLVRVWFPPEVAAVMADTAVLVGRLVPLEEGEGILLLVKVVNTAAAEVEGSFSSALGHMAHTAVVALFSHPGKTALWLSFSPHLTRRKADAVRNFG